MVPGAAKDRPPHPPTPPPGERGVKVRACLCNAGTSEGRRVEQDSALQNYPKVQALLHYFTYPHTSFSSRAPVSGCFGFFFWRGGVTHTHPPQRRGLKADEET